MGDWSGMHNSIVGKLALSLATILVVAGALAGCSEDEPPGGGGTTVDQSSPDPELNQGTNGVDQEPDQGPGQQATEQGRNGNGSGPDSGATLGPGSGVIPPGLAETRLTGVAAGLPGQVGMIVSAPGGPGPQILVGELTAGPAWSTLNLPIAERVLEDGNGPSGVGKQVRGQIKAAISQSDTEAAAALYSRLESQHGGPAGAMEAVRQTTRVVDGGLGADAAPGGGGNSTPGQVIWPLGAQSRYMASLAGGCRGDRATRRFLLAQMAPAEDRESYGLGSIGPSARWVSGSGTGPNGRYLARQTGVFDTGGGSVVVAMMVLPYDGSPEAAEVMLDELAERLTSRFENLALAKRPCPAAGSPAG